MLLHLSQLLPRYQLQPFFSVFLSFCKGNFFEVRLSSFRSQFPWLKQFPRTYSRSQRASLLPSSCANRLLQPTGSGLRNDGLVQTLSATSRVFNHLKRFLLPSPFSLLSSYFFLLLILTVAFEIIGLAQMPMLKI